MLRKNISFLVHTTNDAWKPSKVSGVDYIPLNTDLDERKGTFLLRMAPNTTYPKHVHPQGEEVLLLQGDMTLGDRKIRGGDFVYSPPGSIHGASTEKGCIFLTSVPEAVEFVPTKVSGEFEEREGDLAVNEGAPPEAQSSETSEEDLPIERTRFSD